MNMKLNTLTKLMKWFSISLACAATSLVGVPLDVSYNGSMADETGAPIDGEVFLKLVIATEDGSAVYWNNEEGSDATTVDPAPVSVVVTQGVFSTVLEGIESDVLANDGLYLHVWASDAVDGTFEALGAEPLLSVPTAIRAGSVAVEDLDGDVTSVIADGSINAEQLGTILIDVPFIDADGDGVPDDPAEDGARRVSLQNIIESISDNSKLGFEQVSDEREMFEVLLDVNQPVGSFRGWIEGAPPSANRPFGDYDNHYKDPFPISQVYEYNGGLMPKIDVLDPETKEVLTGVDSALVPGLNFIWSVEDVERTAPNVNTWGPNWTPRARADGWDEGRLVVAGTPTEVGDFPVLVRATNSWGMDFLQLYTVQVRDIEIDEDDGEVFLERQAKGSTTWTTTDADEPIGGDPVRARFVTEDDVILGEEIVVRWTYPNPDSIDPSNTLTVDIPGEVGKVFYVHSSDGDDAGTTSSLGVQLLDENPLISADRSHIGTYSAEILLDWGQAVEIGQDTIDDIRTGYEYPTNALMYEIPAISSPSPDFVPPTTSAVDLFNPFTNTAANAIGMKPSSRYTGQIYGATPAGDQGAPLGDLTPDWHLGGVITGGDAAKELVSYDPWDLIVSGEYIRGSVENVWIQQKRYDPLDSTSATYAPTQYSIRSVETIVTINDVDDPRVDIAVDGFGPDPADDAWPLDMGDGVIHDNVEVRNAWYFPEDGGDLTYLNQFQIESSRQRPVLTSWPILGSTSWNNYLFGDGDKMAIYHLYSTNGFIDSMAPMSAIVEVGSNVNIVNDLAGATQVAGYSVEVGADIGTTNGMTTDLLKPAEEASDTRTVIWGVNDLAYIWSSSNNFLYDVTSTYGNVVEIGGRNLQNKVTGNNGLTDVTVYLNADSGFSNEGTSAGINVISDVVIWDFYVQRVDLLEDPGNPGDYYDKGDVSTVDENLTIAPGDDLVWTVEAYVRPPLYTDLALDEGAVGNYQRDLTAEFWLVPTQTNVPVKITANISKYEITSAGDPPTGTDVDSDDNHVRSIVEDRVLTRWTVILENPLQQLGTTNVATGYLYAEVTSRDSEGNWLNTVGTGALRGKPIAPNGMASIDDDTENADPIGALEENIIGPDFRLDARVKMPLSAATEGVITVDPAATPFPVPAP